MSDFVDSWDSNQPGATWDSGLQWDVNLGPAPGDVQAYLDLVTSEHNQQPNFMRMMADLIQPLADLQVVMSTMPTLYDVDTSVGAQQDTDGLWIGVTRNLPVPLQNVFFSFDTAGVGFDEGTWWNPGDPLTELVSLGDEDYRTLLRARIAANNWDGTIPSAYDIWNTVFAGTGVGILIQDLPHMHMIMALTGPVPDAVTLALFNGSYLDLKPAGVQIDAHMTPTVPNTPYFGFDVENSSISGFDVGAWGKVS